MSEYKHGTSGEIFENGSRLPAQSAGSAFVYIGTAPVQVADSTNVNKPVVCRDFAEFQKNFGYSDDWATYTLCEAAYVHLRQRGVGPIVCINVLDPTTAKSEQEVSVSKTPAGGKVVIESAESVIVSTLTITGKAASTYTTSYDYATKRLTIKETSKGSLGTASLTIKYFTVTSSAVTAATVIGTTDDMGTNTGIYAVKNVYSLTGMIPAFLFAPGWSSDPTVNSALTAIAEKINNHWDAFVYADLPLVNGETALTLATAATYAKANGYDKDNEKVFYPMVEGTDGKKYHLSVLAAAALQQLIADNDGIPYMTSSNTEAAIIQNLYMGESVTGKVYDDDVINRYLNQKGVCSAAFVGGRWAIWGAHAASYDFAENATNINVSETCLMMLYYLSNDFQARRAYDVDQPLTPNDIDSIVADEQMRLDALVKAGALTYGEAYSGDSYATLADVMTGEHAFNFDVTTTPIARALTIVVNHVNDGYYTYFDLEGSAE